ncbi:uncharacterized protein CC84DRAFT_7527 [Paraphaeosphaeria sporulosa]|uniref:Uncharacterized protein n=1 Tax=Paraphaeosphaeria sporulosa TaxID=1460663 RepID=A0A177CWP6_9PLEO|nr:uncharacterized protein CC84DRAFT_7527 [Paraphaeosphaeria sporulosa]OAG11290.1 hypothetical protein CC84DRAFT_7527 [Paraphaeosphaeria sporulosa]
MPQSIPSQPKIHQTKLPPHLHLYLLNIHSSSHCYHPSWRPLLYSQSSSVRIPRVRHTLGVRISHFSLRLLLARECTFTAGIPLE